MRFTKERIGEAERLTREVNINVKLNLDGTGKYKIKTPLKFLNHMLESFAEHSGFDLQVNADGDVDVDNHHLVEDLGLCMGEALDKALGEKIGIERMYYFIAPMDDSKAIVSVDLSGRPYAVIDLPFSDFHEKKVGDVSKENIVHFLESLAMSGKFNLSVKVEGKNDHHKVEATFKALARALRHAVEITGRKITSTKGVL